MAINSSNFAAALWPGVKAWYEKYYAMHAEEWKDLFDMYKSDKQFEEDIGYSGFGILPVKPEGQAIAYDTSRQGFKERYTHVEYASGFVVTEIAKEDDQYGVVAERGARELAHSVHETKNIVGANIYNNAFDNSFTYGDGVELCSLLHPNISGGTWANELATAADLSEASLEQACIDIMKFTNDRGLRINVMPETLHIPPELLFEAERILMSTYRVGTADNDINALKNLSKFRGGVKVNHYFTDPDAFFIRTNVDNGMKYYERRPDRFGADNDFDTANAKFKASIRFSVGASDKRAIYGSPGA